MRTFTTPDNSDLLVIRSGVQKPNSCAYNFLEVLGIILRVLTLAASVYNVYIKNQFQPLLPRGEGGVKTISRGDCE